MRDAHTWQRSNHRHGGCSGNGPRHNRDGCRNRQARKGCEQTGLAGPFDWELKWTPELCLRNGCPGFPQIDPDGPSIFQAVQEQLGLKLVSEPGQKEVLVIDQVERPSEN